jgi:hypothetical protein
MDIYIIMIRSNRKKIGNCHLIIEKKKKNKNGNY